MRRYASVTPWRRARQSQDACLCADCLKHRPERAALIAQERSAVKALTNRNLRLRGDGTYYRR